MQMDQHHWAVIQLTDLLVTTTKLILKRTQRRSPMRVLRRISTLSQSMAPLAAVKKCSSFEVETLKSANKHESRLTGQQGYAPLAPHTILTIDDFFTFRWDVKLSFTPSQSNFGRNS